MARGELYAKFSRKFGQLAFGGRSGHLGSCGFSGGCRITIPKISWRFAEIALASLAKLAREATPYLLSRAVFQCRPTGAPMRTPPTSAAFSSYRSGVVRQRSCFNHNVFTSNSAHLRASLLAAWASACELARGTHCATPPDGRKDLQLRTLTATHSCAHFSLGATAPVACGPHWHTSADLCVPTRHSAHLNSVNRWHTPCCRPARHSPPVTGRPAHV